MTSDTKSARGSGARPRGDWVWSALWPPIGLLAMALAATAPLAGGRVWPMGHDGLLCHYRLDHFREAVREGVLYPRWLPTAFGGYGYPTFVYYPPGFFYAALPPSLVFEEVTTAVYVTLVGLFFAGAGGAYLLARRWGDRFFSLVCAALFTITPYVWVDLYVRNALAELSALLVSPWPIVCLLRLAEFVEAPPSAAGGASPRFPLGAFAGLSAALAAIVYCHPATALFLWPGAACLAGWIAARGAGRRMAFAASVFAAYLLAAAMSIPYWQPLWSLRHAADHAAAVGGYFAPADHLVTVPQLLSPAWDYGLSRAGADDEMPFSLGLPHFLMAAAGVVAGRRWSAIQAAAAIYALLILLMTPLAAPLWKSVGLLAYVQFPWRLLSVTAVYQTLCIAGAGKAVARASIPRLLLAGIPVCAIAWSFEQFLPPPTTIDRADALIAEMRRTRLTTFQTYCGRDEFTPVWALSLRAVEPPRGDRPVVTLARPDPSAPWRRRIRQLGGHSDYRIQYALSSGPPVTVTIEQLYFPGWEIRLNGRKVKVADLRRTPDGRIQVRVDATDGRVLLARYASPPQAILRRTVAGVGLAICAAFAVAAVVRWGVGRTAHVPPPNDPPSPRDPRPA